MVDVDLSGDGLNGFDFDQDHRGLRYPYTSRVSWPITIPADPNASRSAPLHQSANTNPSNIMKRSTTPLQSLTQAYDQPAINQSQAYIPDWRLHQQPQAQHFAYPLDTYPQQFGADAGYAMPYQTSPSDYVSQVQYDPNPYLPIAGPMDGSMAFNWQDISNDLMNYPLSNGLPDMNLSHHNLPNSPTDTSLEVRSLSSSDNGWNSVEYPQQPLDRSYQDPHTGNIFNPEQTLHGRTFSDSSYSDVEQQSRQSWGSYVNLQQHAIGSPSSDNSASLSDIEFHHDHADFLVGSPPIKQEQEQHTRSTIVTSSVVKPIRIKTSSSPQQSPTSTGRISPPGRRQAVKKNSNSKATKPTIRRQPQAPKVDTEKRVGRRKGPLRPEQRKQASEIRKLGACIRCKFLKKTCDTGEPCEGCQPSHARLWQVPCTRIDIKEVAYFMKDWRADYERHVSLGFSICNIKGFAEQERTLFITHGYGHMLPVRAREVFVRDESCFGLDWVESVSDFPSEHSVNTAKLSAGVEGIPDTILSEYLDNHIDGGFVEFVDEYFDGTPFLTQMLKTAYRYWCRERTPVIRKCLKLLIAYNLTQHVTMVEGIPEEEGFLGKITDSTSKFYGKTVAPVMINFQIKDAMATMWRELQKEVLEELSHLYSSVYTKDKLRHWPTIFMVAAILLSVWEEMQFDCHYRIPDREVVSKFCHDMESTPVGVIVGLFSAISQKLPAFQEWETRKHHHLLNSNPAVCEALTEVRQHVTRHDNYLRSRCDTTFDRDDFDSLCGKFTSKLVIRASAC